LSRKTAALLRTRQRGLRADASAEKVDVWVAEARAKSRGGEGTLWRRTREGGRREERQDDEDNVEDEEKI
jgi:hypothetical protein